MEIFMTSHWLVHEKGLINDLFYPVRIGNKLCLILRKGGVIYKPMSWLKKEKKHLFRLNKF